METLTKIIENVLCSIYISDSSSNKDTPLFRNEEDTNWWYLPIFHLFYVFNNNHTPFPKPSLENFPENLQRQLGL